MNHYRWIDPQRATSEAVDPLVEALGIPGAGARFLLARDMDADSASRYLNPSPADSHDPFLFSRMREAVALVQKAAREKRSVMVHGDYDVDGISGTALLYQYLDGVVPEVYRFVPDRRRDGYGVSERAVAWALENNVGLVIAVDCGTSDAALIERLEDAGVDVIVCDHHQLPADGVTRGVLLNPSRKDETYPFRALSGTGVAFKFVQALHTSGVRGNVEPDALLDLNALATVGDMCPLVGENRWFVRAGLERINRDPRPGLHAMRALSRLAGREITASHISFALAPRINAPGRISRPKPSLEILCTNDRSEARRLASVLEGDNERRRELTRQVEDEVVALVRGMDDLDARGGIVLAGAGWDEGVLGIAAARVVDEFARPTILMSVKDDIAKGSGRSVPGVDLKAQLDFFQDRFVRYGGHAAACGLTMEAARVGDFADDFAERLREFVTPDEARALSIDASLDLEECTMDLLDFIRRCEPFGFGNRTPVWRISDVQILRDTGIVGDGHMKLYFQDTRGNPGEAIAFGWDRDETPDDLHGRVVDLAVHVRRGEFNGRVYPELRLVDIRHPA